MKDKIAVVLLNLGGPDKLEAVKPFLENLFSDKDIFKIPIFQKPIAKLIAQIRAIKACKEYKMIGGCSPLNFWTERQRSLLENYLRDELNNVEVYVAMRYWHPLIIDVAKHIPDENYKRIFLLPLYPQYSLSTTGSSFNEWNRNYRNSDTEPVYIHSFYSNNYYISAIKQRIDEALDKFPHSVYDKVQILFSAHGIPASFIRKGDPYPYQINETIKLVMESKNYSHEFHLCYQSKVGPIKWIGPSFESKMRELLYAGKKNLLVVPISFVSDHIETLYELKIKYRYIAEKLGAENYIVTSGLNDSEFLILALKEEICKRL